MANPTPANSRIKVDPTLADLLNLKMKELLLNLNCHAIATVQSFNSDVQTVTATINYKKSFKQRGADGIYRSVLIDYPILLDVPVIVLGGGAWKLTFPISKGDECLILFNDRDIDNWFQSGQVGQVASNRLHSFSDGIALVGLQSSINALEDYDTTRAKLYNGSTMVGVSADKIKIANALYTLNGLLQDLLTAIKAITVTVASTPGPSSTPVNAATFTTIASHLGSLLE